MGSSLYSPFPCKRSLPVCGLRASATRKSLLSFRSFLLPREKQGFDMILLGVEKSYGCIRLAGHWALNRSVFLPLSPRSPLAAGTTRCRCCSRSSYGRARTPPASSIRRRWTRWLPGISLDGRWRCLGALARRRLRESQDKEWLPFWTPFVMIKNCFICATVYTTLFVCLSLSHTHI